MKNKLYLLGLIIFISSIVIYRLMDKEHFASRLDTAIPNQLLYWNKRKRGIVREYDGEKFYELDTEGNLKLTSKGDRARYTKYLGKNENYYGPLTKDGKFVAIDGLNIDVIRDISLDACKVKCDKNNKCQGISYNSSQRKCALEKHSCANAPEFCRATKGYWRAYEKLETNDRLISKDNLYSGFGEAVAKGVEENVSNNVYIKGHNVNSKVIKTSVNGCKSKCLDNPACAAVSYKEGECWLEKVTCKEAGSDCIHGGKAKGWRLYELSNSTDKGGLKNNYYKVQIKGKDAAITGYNYKLGIKAHSLEKCTDACDSAGSKCKGVEYKKSKKKCNLSSALCRSVKPGKCAIATDGYDSYEKKKYLGPYYIQCKQVYGGKPYLAMKSSTGRGDPLVMAKTKNDYAKWLFHPDGSIQNLKTKKFISFSGSIKDGARLVSGNGRRRWFVDRFSKGWKPTYWSGNILYVANKKYFIYNNRNGHVTAEVENKKGKVKNPNYCKASTVTYGSKYLENAEATSKSYGRASWSLVKTSY